MSRWNKILRSNNKKCNAIVNSFIIELITYSLICHIVVVCRSSSMSIKTQQTLWSDFLRIRKKVLQGSTKKCSRENLVITFHALSRFIVIIAILIVYLVPVYVKKCIDLIGDLNASLNNSFFKIKNHLTLLMQGLNSSLCIFHPNT